MALLRTRVADLMNRDGLRSRQSVGVALRLADQAEPNRLQHRLVLVCATELVGRVVHVQRRRALCDAENIANLPRRLAFHRPAQGLELARRQCRNSRLGRRWGENSKRGILR